VEFRLLSFYCVLLLALGGVFSMFTVASFDRFESETVQANLESRAREIWTFAAGALDQPTTLREVLERRFSPAAQDRFIRITSSAHILYESGPPASADFDPGVVPLPARDHPLGGTQYGRLYLFTMDFRSPDGRLITIESGQTTPFAHTIRENLISSLLLGLPVLLAFAALGGYFLMQQVFSPLSRMIQVAEAITFNDPHNRLPTAGTGDRIDVLAQSLNRMLDRLDSAYQHASRFSADAAHELRTPLAIIRGELEYVAGHPGLPEELRNALSSTSEEVRRLVHMAEDLLTIANMDSVWGKKEHTSIDLTRLTTDTIEQMNLVAEEKGLALRVHASGPAFVSGDRNRLKQVLVNLLDNAIKYTPRGGTVDVSVQSHAGLVLLSVRDDGIGVPAEHHEDIFRRFFRMSTDRGQTGAGLGLSIARSICQAHGGTLNVRSTFGEGSEFRMELPIERS
jgi:signal transduction histidine kinase